MINIALFQPEIPQNTGNIIRLSANCGIFLHLIRPFGFVFSDKNLRRAGLDYHELADMTIYDHEEDFFALHSTKRIFALTTKAKKFYTDTKFEPGDFFLFGPESRGLPDYIRQSIGQERLLKIPQRPESRSLNLSNSVAIVAYEALRQLNFEHLS